MCSHRGLHDSCHTGLHTGVCVSVYVVWVYEVLELCWGVAIGTFLCICLGLSAEGLPLQLVGLPISIRSGPKNKFHLFVKHWAIICGAL